MFEPISIIHMHTSQALVHEIMGRVSRHVEVVQKAVGQMRSRKLTTPERDSFAERVMHLRFGGNPGMWPIERVDILKSRRPEDDAKTLWGAFNIVQENVIRGGVWSGRLDSNGRWFAPTREITSFDREMRLNEGLWSIAASYLN
jgi:hypothetical protein